MSNCHDGPKCSQHLLINLQTILYTNMFLHPTSNYAWHATKTYTLVDLQRNKTNMHAGIIASITALCSSITLMLTDVLAVCAVDESAY